MRDFIQLDNNVVTGKLIAEHAPTVLPPGRTFVEVTEQEAGEIDSGDTFDPVVVRPKDHAHLEGFTKRAAQPPVESFDNKLDRVLGLLEQRR
jgi:hypothetical protein